MKMLYTKEELLELTSEELLDIISIVSLDGRVIFLDNVVMIEPDCLVMDNSQDNINITSHESLKLISDKMTRFKFLKATGAIDDLKEKNHLEKMISTRLDSININIDTQLANINNIANQNFEKSIEHITKIVEVVQTSILHQISEVSGNLTKNVVLMISPTIEKIKEETNELRNSIDKVNSDIRRINFTKLTDVTNNLETISKLLAEVIED